MKIVTHLRDVFCSYRIKRIDAFRKEGNPFEEQPLINLVAKTVVPPDTVESICTAYAIGERQSIQVVDKSGRLGSLYLYMTTLTS